ncbi:hypothetical protein NFI96_028734 [Prochilodus magdalenae]|nr:hypothetical protein NFI96_028734 [Prochilodus magdalenae]
MFRSMNSEKHFSSGGPQSPAVSLDGANVARSENSWISVLSMVYRPAWSLLQKYLPGRAQASDLTPWDRAPGQSKMDMGNSLHSLMPDSPRLNVAYVHCQHENAEALSWLAADSLAELGIQDAADTDFKAQHPAPARYLTVAKNLLSQGVLNPASAQKDASSADRQSHLSYANSWWWDGLWGTSDGPENVVPNSSRTRTSNDPKWQHCEKSDSSGHCCAAECGSVVTGDDVDSMLRESAGPPCFKELADNNDLHMPRPESLPNSEQLSSVHEHTVVSHLAGTRAVAACSEVAVLTPDQDNGYSSLEEENANTKQLNMKLVGDEQGSLESDSPAASQGGDAGTKCEGVEAEGRPQCEEANSKVEEQKEEASETARAEDVSAYLSTPRCQNKAIAYIMGSPCSDESDSDSDSDWNSDDDDGFDSEGSSHFSDTEDLDDSDDGDEEEDDSEADGLDSESERLWNSLCQNRDPYNPRNFTAPIRTATNASAAAVDSPLSGSPAEPDHSPFSSPSPLVPQEEESSDETWSVDESEHMMLWNSFNCSSDPYNPLNFQAPTRTRETAGGSCRKRAHVGPPIYNKEEAEDRLDSGFSETALVQGLGSSRCVRLKKVTFVEEVEEFYASSDEDRRGPWEEFARDRCRFQRRVQEVEETISYCLSPTFRLVIFQRLYHSS